MPSILAKSNTTGGAGEVPSADPPLPFGWTPVSDACPFHDKPVMAIRRSDYLSCQFEIITARYQPDYRPNSPWRMLCNNAVGDSGAHILGWCEAQDWLLPA